MAGSGRKVFAPGEVLTATNVQNYLMDQAVQVYAGTAARGSAIGSATTEGMVSWLSDTDQMQVATGTATWADVSFAQSPNAIINGAFDIWQRGTTFTNPGGTYSADRWASNRDSTTTCDISRQTFTPGNTIAGYEPAFFFRATGTVVSGNAFYALQRVEDVRSFAGQTVTLSYWAKANTNVNNTPIYIQNFGSGGSSNVISASLATHAITSSWQRFSVTFNVPSISGKTIGTSSLLELQVIRCTSTATVDLWGVQLEQGPVATPFRRNAPSIQAELAACQRYYWRATATGVDGRLAQGVQATTTSSSVLVYLPSEFRVKPTSVGYSSVAWTDTYSFSATVSAATLHAGTNSKTVTVELTHSSAGAPRYPGYLSSPGGSGYLELSAEL